ncbi:MAG: hypothetical protein M1838_000264 [Thelocarpon superellum]|nr:MAG: hypothetical protein M1838_000264 [Thelocarpon superellum]
MPRQRRSAAPAARRPTVAPARPNVTPPQQGPNRSATTLARPVGPNGVQGQGPATQTQQPGQKQPGLFGQMVSTAAGVAIGSSIGHSIGGFFGGSSDNAATAESQGTNDNAAMGYDGGNTAATNANAHSTSSSWGAPSCEQDARSFTKCLDQNGGNMQICGWYLEQLKACQQAASQY